MNVKHLATFSHVLSAATHRVVLFRKAPGYDIFERVPFAGLPTPEVPVGPS
jgi:hypothetical protein